MAGSAEGDATDPAAQALENLVTELDACIAELQHARARSESLLAETAVRPSVARGRDR